MKNSGKNQETRNGVLLLKPHSHKEIAAMYNVSSKTFSKWIKPFEKQIGNRKGNFYMKEQVNKIFSKLGHPKTQIGISQQEVVRLMEKAYPLVRYVNAAWDFAKAVLWSGKKISTEEEIISKKFLNEYFSLNTLANDQKCLQKRLSVFCQRVLLTRLYVDYRPAQRFVPNPSLWFDKEYKFGFAGTLRWFKVICEARQVNPNHRHELKFLADRYNEFVESKTSAATSKAANYLMEKNQIHLLKIFCEAMAELENKSNYFMAA